MSGDQDFEKFREKKLNERAAQKHEDDAAFFGTQKKKKDDEDGPKKLKLTDLNLPEEEREVPKVGESVKLIDIALENAPGAGPQKVGPSHVQHNSPPRPVTGKPAPRPQGTPAPRAGQPTPPPRPTAARPGMTPQAAPRPTGPQTPPPRPTGPQPNPLAGHRAPGQKPPGAGPYKPGGTAQFKPKPLPAPTPSKPVAPPAGFKDRASESSARMQAVTPPGFEFEEDDTNFVEKTEHEDPYEFKDDGKGGPQFDESYSAKSSSRRVPAVPPPTPKPGGDASKSGKLKGVKPQPPIPQPKKTSTRRVKRGPLGR